MREMMGHDPFSEDPFSRDPFDMMGNMVCFVSMFAILRRRAAPSSHILAFIRGAFAARAPPRVSSPARGVCARDLSK